MGVSRPPFDLWPDRECAAFTFVLPPMSIKLRESFQVRVPPERVWRFLIDPAQVVRCLPGAELTETVDERTYRGRVKVKVGPISSAYDGTARLTEVDAVARRMQMIGEGREIGAAGSAKMTMIGTVTAHSDGGSQIDVDATIDIAGRVMQFGGGLIESVSRQLFRQFADAVRQTLEQEQAPALVAETAAVATPPVPPAPRELRIVPLLLRALADWVRRLFKPNHP